MTYGFWYENVCQYNNLLLHYYTPTIRNATAREMPTSTQRQTTRLLKFPFQNHNTVTSKFDNRIGFQAL